MPRRKEDNPLLDVDVPVVDTTCAVDCRQEGHATDGVEAGSPRPRLSRRPTPSVHPANPVVETQDAQQPFFDKVFAKSCEDMDDLPDGSVALTVTSPPYWNAIDYDRHAADPNQYYRTRHYAVGYSDYEDYLEWYTRVSGEILRVTKPGGFYAVVIGTVLMNGTHFPVPFDVTGRFGKSGWTFHQDFIWHKVTGGVKRAGVFLQQPYPGYFYPNIMTEYILVFRKPGPPIFKEKAKEEKAEAKVATERLFTNDIANNVWHIAPVPPGHLDHPCPFPEEIPYRLIQLYSYPGDLVLDPFCGSGQTLKVARYTSRHYVGYDISEEYVALSRRRVNECPGLRAEQIVAAWEKIPIDAERAGASRGAARSRYGKRRTPAVAKDGRRPASGGRSSDERDDSRGQGSPPQGALPL